MRAALPLMFDVTQRCATGGFSRAACIARRLAVTVGVLATLLLAFATKPAYAGDLAVSYVTVEKSASFVSERRYAGKVVAARRSALGFKRGGEIADVLVDLGDVVEAGDVLARLDDRATRAELQQARANTALAEANVAAVSAEWQLAHNTERRFRRLKDEGHVAQQVYDEAALKLAADQARLNVARANLAAAKAAEQGVEVMLAEAAVLAPLPVWCSNDWSMKERR